jgi:uncharacterized integral membrane protein
LVFRRVISAVILIPLMVVVVAFAVANRQAVTVSFDPLSPAAPAYAVTLPLFILLFVVLIAGVIVGGMAVWFGQRRIRRARRRLEAELAGLHREINGMRRAREESAPVPRTPQEPQPPLILPPVA